MGLSTESEGKEQQAVTEDIDGRILNVNIQDLMDFCFCPKICDFRDDGKRTLMQEYNNAIINVFYKYLNELKKSNLNRKDIYKRLKTNWGISWIKEKTLSEIEIYSINPNTDSYGKRRRAGSLAIEAFVNLMDEPQYPISVNSMYSVPIIKNEINLIGVWDYIREVEVNGEKRIQLIKFLEDTSKHSGNRTHNNSIDIVAASYAFKKLFKMPFDFIIMDTHTNSIKGKKTFTIISNNEYKMLEQTVISYVQCIKNNIRLISPGAKCSLCEYRWECYPEHFKGGRIV